MHLGAFVALIYGLALANVLAHFATLIKHGRQAGWYWIHTLWAIYLMLMMAGFWWTLQNWAPVPNIAFLSYLSVLLTPSLMFIAADLLFPERAAGVVDLKAHFFRIKRPLFLVIIAVQELTFAANEIQATYYVPFASFVCAMMLYWLLCLGVEAGVRAVLAVAERRR